MKFIIDKSGYPIEAWQDGRRVHMILSESHFNEIRDASNMTRLDDYDHYIEYLQNNGFINLTDGGLPSKNG